MKKREKDGTGGERRGRRAWKAQVSRREKVYRLVLCLRQDSTYRKKARLQDFISSLGKQDYIYRIVYISLVFTGHSSGGLSQSKEFTVSKKSVLETGFCRVLVMKLVSVRNCSCVMFLSCFCFSFV